jgi:hypothetical protein
VAGSAIEAALGQLKHVEHLLFAAALGVAVGASLWLHVCRRRGCLPRPRRNKG